jgi:hypothetical protein
MTQQETTRCPNCSNGVEQILSFAVLAPWLAELLGFKSAGKYSELMNCNFCDFRFFTYRYSELEMSAIYSTYRGERYFQTRHKWEPWYSQKTMNAWNPEQNSFGVTARKNHLLEILQQSGIQLGNSCNVLDFGGDLGQFFPEGLNGKKYLFDPSQPPLQKPGVERIQSLEGLSRQIGLIMNAHTLEHLPFFRRVLGDLGPCLTESGVLYIEVPMDAFQTNRIHRNHVYLKYLKLVYKFPQLFKFLDFLSGLYRTVFRRIPFWGIVKQSEHINYFSKASLTYLAKSANFELLRITEPDYTFGQGAIKLGRISMVLKNP